MNALNRANPDEPVREPSAVPEPADQAGGQSLVIPVLSEQVQVGTVHEHIGTVRVRKVVHQDSEPVGTEGYRERVETTRVPVNQVVQAVQPPRQQGDVLVIPVYEERMVRQLVLREELHVQRRREPCPDSASVPLRREEVIVERLDPQTRQWVPEGR